MITVKTITGEAQVTEDLTLKGDEFVCNVMQSWLDETQGLSGEGKLIGLYYELLENSLFDVEVSNEFKEILTNYENSEETENIY